MSGPLELDADLVLTGPLGTGAPPGTILIAAARLDLSAGLELPGVTAKAQRFGVDVAAGFSLVRGGNLLGGYLQIDPPRPRLEKPETDESPSRENQNTHLSIHTPAVPNNAPTARYA